MTYDPGDVVVIMFPFSDMIRAKPRPALVVSTRKFNEFHRQALVLMITTATHTQWKSDTKITALEACGLKQPSSVRMKCFTLDTRLIKKRIGIMHKSDRALVRKKLKTVVAL